MKRVLSLLLTLTLVLSAVGVATIVGSADDGAKEIEFRGFESASSDYSCNLGTVFIGKATGTNGVYPAVGNGFAGGKTTAEMKEIHHYVYAYKQNGTDAADGSNADGMVKLLIEDPTQMYVSLDLYVSDASLVNNPAGDCGFGVDTVEFGTKENWGSTFYASRNTMLPLLKNLQDGWNHLLIPLTVKKNAYKTEMVNQTVTFCTMRLYVVGVTLPAGFVSAVDDVRIMNKQAALTTYPERTLAKTVTDGIRNYPATATYGDFYKVYAAYKAAPEKYQSLILGWDSFISANGTHKSQGDTDAAADKAAAASANNAVDALNKTITKEDKAAIEAARASYNALSETQKLFVLHAPLLTEAETQLATIIKAENQAKADEVRVLIAALPKTITAQDKQAVEAARAAFNALTAEQQAMVINKAILEKAEASLAKIEDQAAANAVYAMIDALPDTITVAEKAAVAAAREAYDALTDSQKALVSNVAQLEEAEEQVKNLKEDEPVNPNPPTPGQYALGDLDGDGEVNAKDALLILKFAVNKIEKFPIEE